MSFTQHKDVTFPFPISGAGSSVVQHCPKCGKIGQAKIRFRGRRMYAYFDHYGTKKHPTSHHIRYSHSHYLGPVTNVRDVIPAMRWRTRKLMAEMQRRKLENV